MIRISTAVVALTALLIFSSGAQAAPIYDFSTGYSTGVTQLGPSEDFSGILGTITASAFYLDGTTWTASELIARNDDPNDNGLGNCSPDEGCPDDGNYNELSQLENNEAILLRRPDNTQWSALYVSSLDDNGGGSGGPENGTLYWGNTSDLATLINPLNSYSFSFGSLLEGGTAVEGQLDLPIGFNSFARYMLFVPGGNLTDDNDYLVWGADLRESREEGDVPVPEPASLLLLGSGLVALARANKRRRDGRR